MWYENCYRRHLCDMHVDDWNPEFLSEFSPEKYVENLKKAKIQSAMIYFQSHVGLAYYPTNTGKIHNAFSEKPDTMRRLAELCHENGINVTGYYSLIYNNFAYINHPEWRIVDNCGRSRYGINEEIKVEFASNRIYRYGLCCPNNKEYRAFVSEQIKEIAEYFTFDGMFFDMLFWPQVCYCDSCREKWANEVGGDIPVNEDWNDPRWLLFMKKRSEWMGAFANSVTEELKSYAPGASVEHNVSHAVLPNGISGTGDSVLDACDYVGGDLYGGIYRQSFTCKFYRNATNHQPFEYMFSRCTPTLSYHTSTKSVAEMESEVFLTAAHHGATLVIDAIDPRGTLDERVYQQVGSIFQKQIPYEKYFKGDMIEDIGFYYSLKSKFNKEAEAYNNHLCCVNGVETMIYNNIPHGVTGHRADITKYKVLVASCLTEQDSDDFDRLVNYVAQGGNLYISGGHCGHLLKEFFGVNESRRTKEKVVYIAPTEENENIFLHYNQKYPMHFNGTAPVFEGAAKENIVAYITLPYTNQDTVKFVSIHSNPPGVPTNIPSMLYTDYGKGKVFWSALPIEALDMYDYRIVFVNILKIFFGYEPTVKSDAPKDVEILSYTCDNEIYVNVVQLNSDYTARKIAKFGISLKCGVSPKKVCVLPEEKEIPFEFSDGVVTVEIEKLDCFEMLKLSF